MLTYNFKEEFEYLNQQFKRKYVKMIDDSSDSSSDDNYGDEAFKAQ